jgi:hypothetical protein
MAKSLQDFIFKMSGGQIIASVLIVGCFLVFLLIRAISNISMSTSTPVALLMLTLFLLLSRLSIIVKVGIGFLSFILFAVQMVFGPLVSFAMIASTTLIYCYIATRPTPIDFAITKGVSASMAQFVYLSLWTVAMIVLFRFLTVEYIMSNLVMVYMISVLIYVAFMVVCLPIFAREPIPVVIVNGMMMTTFQYFLIKYFGQSFMQYVISLA